MTVRSQTRPAPHPDAHASVINTTANPSYPTYANAEKNTSGMLNAAAIPLMPPIVARWRTLRCQECRRPLQRALLMPGSVTLATCRRDRVTFVFVVTETGKLLVMRRERT